MMERETQTLPPTPVVSTALSHIAVMVSSILNTEKNVIKDQTTPTLPSMVALSSVFLTTADKERLEDPPSTLLWLSPRTRLPSSTLAHGLILLALRMPNGCSSTSLKSSLIINSTPSLVLLTDSGEATDQSKASEPERSADHAMPHHPCAEMVFKKMESNATSEPSSTLITKPTDAEPTAVTHPAVTEPPTETKSAMMVPREALAALLLAH